MLVFSSFNEERRFFFVRLYLQIVRSSVYFMEFLGSFVGELERVKQGAYGRMGLLTSGKCTLELLHIVGKVQ